jgi:hypothetical protein
MRISQGFRACLIAAMAMLGAVVSSAAHADAGIVRLTLIKAGWFIGGSGGYGTLTYHGRVYPLSIGGLSAGLVFGASGTHFVGTVTNIYRPTDVTGVYGAASAGVAVAIGVGGIVLTNEKGAVLHLTGREIGLIANADLNGMGISMR